MADRGGTGLAASFRTAFGPGLLFAGTAIGLSHLVQSTRAGAVYGLAIGVVILLIHVLKYPLFRFGAYYTVASGESLIEGYRRQGVFAVWLLLGALLCYMFFAMGAVGMLSAALVKNVFGIELDTRLLGAIILGGGVVFLLVGRFHWLDRVNKVLVSVLAVSTLLAALFSIPKLELSQLTIPAERIDLKLLLFVAAIGGFMPVSTDSSVWQSVWTLAKAKDAGVWPRLRDVLMDFNIGYWGSAIFAVCFLIMGAAMMNRAGIAPAAEAVPFAEQLIGLYRDALGDWAVPLIGASVISVMLTTALTGLDALPRVLVAITRVLRGEPVGRITEVQLDGTAAYRLYVVLLAAGSIAAIYFLADSFRTFLDFGTTVAFLVAPVIAILNHRSVFGPAVPADLRPGRGMWWFSMVGIAAFVSFTVTYFVLLLGGYL
ncbi:NRAMP family divalent metal transporter [Elongatibacter sediminis]|uniref:Permease n=1 Tax=Elongatibacter sediminis TaxID=3119006 RepID=A0AAW9R7M0_9GAMM